MDDLVFSNWMLRLIRKDSIALGWLEEKRFDWSALVHQFVSNILEGHSIVICTDLQRKWFCQYILQAINTNTERPLIPIFSIYDILGANVKTDLIEDMLNVAFGQNYTSWYIGHTNNTLCNLVSSNKNNFIWSLDTPLHRAFTIDAKGSECDIRLLQLFGILNKTISAMMFDEII